MKTPHRLMHDAKEAGAITEQEWRAFMRARNEDYEESKDGLDLDSRLATDVLYEAFCWEESREGGDFWLEIKKRLDEYEEINQEAGQ